MYNSERASFLSSDNLSASQAVPDSEYTFEVRVETDLRQVSRQVQRALSDYKQEKRGPTFIVVQAALDFQVNL